MSAKIHKIVKARAALKLPGCFFKPVLSLILFVIHVEGSFYFPQPRLNHWF